MLPGGTILPTRFSRVEELLRSRKPILETPLEAASIDLDALPGIIASEGAVVAADPPDQPSLTELFPDLGVYTGPVPPEEEKVHKRLDEGYTNGHRIAHTSRLLDARPVLVSTLQPAENNKDGVWDLHDGEWFEDPKGSTDISDETVAITTSVFTGRGKHSQNPKHVRAVVMPPAQQLRHQHVWTDEEDEMLLHLVKTYRDNWQLISDTFNSEVVGIPTDKPSAYECWDRWYWTWGGGKGQARPEAVETKDSPVPGTAIPSASATTSAPGTSTPTTARQANGDATGPEGAPPPPGMSKREARAAGKHKYEGTKKAIRHQAIYDAMRRLSRRREQAKPKGSGEFSVIRA